MKNLLLVFCGAFLFSCSSEENGGEMFLVQREQQDLSYIYYQSEELYSQFKERITDRSQGGAFISRMKKTFVQIQELDQEIWSVISDLEEVKANLISEWTGSSGNELVINEFGGKNNYIQVYDLSKTNHSTTSNYSIDSQNGKLIESTLSGFRKVLTEKLVQTSTFEERKFNFKDTGIPDFKDLKDLRNKVEKLVRVSNVAPDDKEMLIRVYMSLSFSKHEWKQLLPEETTYLNIFRIICHLEKEILKARQNVFALINSRYCMAEYGFDKIMAIAEGKNIVGAGDTLELQITMAAFNSSLSPVIKCTNGKVTNVSAKNGIGKIQVVAPQKGEQKVTYKGTITILNKRGQPKTQKWEKEVWVHE